MKKKTNRNFWVIFEKLFEKENKAFYFLVNNHVS